MVEVARTAQDAAHGECGGWYHDSNWLTLGGGTSACRKLSDLDTQVSISS